MVPAALISEASNLLSNREQHKKSEGNAQSDIESLFRTMGVGTIESHYQLGQLEADIFLPNKRTFVEVKKYPHAADPEKRQSRKGGESPREQLDRYVHREIEYEQNLLGLRDAVVDNLPKEHWTGIVTDGSHWHIYNYPDKVKAKGSLKHSQLFITEARALIELLSDELGTDLIGKEWIPDEPAYLFTDFKIELDGLYHEMPKRIVGPTETKKQLWLDLMLTSGMVPQNAEEQLRLFLAHSFLIVVVRLVSCTLWGSAREEEFYESLRDGFASWILEFARGKAWINRLSKVVSDYDWRRRRSDVLRELYHQYVDKKDRKVFGEFYTPDWLARFMVDEVLDEEWIEESVKKVRSGDVQACGVLDPACGSGTFLYHAALRILESTSVGRLRRGEKANTVARLINGIDIHPVAVEIARVNLQRALPVEPSEGASAYQIFLGDSLQTDDRGDIIFSHSDDVMLLTTPKAREVRLPMSFVADPSFAENMRRLVNSADEGVEIPFDITEKFDNVQLENCYRELQNIIKEEGNSVWTWYAINLAGPHLLSKRKVDRIVANPPWVKLSDIQTEYRKRTMEKYGYDLNLQIGGKQAPHLDIASFFILQARNLYLANPDENPGAWLVKKSALRSGHWELFRKAHARTLKQSIDLEKLNPFQGGDATRC